MATQPPVGGMGTKFMHDVSGTYEVLGQVTSISGPTMSVETIDVTALDSVGGFRKFITSLKDGGEISLTMNFTYDTYLVMKTAYDDNCSKRYAIVLPDGASSCGTGSGENSHFIFDALVTELPVNIAVDSQITSDVTLKIDGEVIFGKSASFPPPSTP